jgi:hypothetical protein
MAKYRKGEGVPRSLVMRLLDNEVRGEWPRYETVLSPEIQKEAAKELLRLENLVTLHMNFLVSKSLFAEFVAWADQSTRETRHDASG